MQSNKVNIDGAQYTASRTGDDRSYHGHVSLSSKRQSLDRGRSRSVADNGMIQVGQDGLDVVLVMDFDDAALVTMGRYAQSASVGSPTGAFVAEDPHEFLSGGLAQQSMESIRVTFAVRGASRVLTHQLVRTRQAAFKQQSQRDCWYGYAPEFRMPESVWVQQEARDAFLKAIYYAHRAYDKAVQNDVPFEDARYILPEGTTNFILCEYSLRTFKEMYAYRGCVMFQDEMVSVVRAMRNILVGHHPYLEDILRISCELPKKCTFQGREKVEGSCPFPWATEDNRTFKPRVYLGEEGK